MLCLFAKVMIRKICNKNLLDLPKYYYVYQF